MDKIDLLRLNAAAFYLDEGFMSLTDQEYDALEVELGISGKTLIGFPEEKSALPKKVRTMDSKTQVKTDFNEVIKGIKNALKLPKWDGCSLVAYYKYRSESNESRLYKVVSKSSGLDKTLYYSQFFPSILKGQVKYVQGEAVIDLIHGFGEKSRQKANGLVNSKYKGADINKYITVKLFALCTSNAITPLIKDSLPPMKGISLSDEWDTGVVDGNVFTAPDGSSFLIDGVVAYHATGAIKGYKFYFTDSASTRIKNIKWQKSSFLCYSPVAVFDTIKIEGCNISKASMGSVSKMMKDGKGIGAEVNVIRANSTIPKILSVAKRSSEYGDPHCPYCDTPFDLNKLVGSKCYCWNSSCSSESNRMSKILKEIDWKNEPSLITEKWLIKLINLPIQSPKSATLKGIKDMMITGSLPEKVDLGKLSPGSKK